MYYLSASDIEVFYRCRELFRQSFYALGNRDTVRPAIHMEFGSAIHSGCEVFWRGGSYREAFSAATKAVGKIDYSKLTAKDIETWKRLLEGLPEMLEAYFNHFGSREDHELLVVYDQPMVEYEWSQQVSDDVTLVGKIDHVFAAPRTLADVKTASEIGDWKVDLRNQQARSTQFGLYDWFLCQSGLPPEKIVVEVITKPYRGSKAKVVQLDLTKWIIAGRARFASQLKFKVKEMAHWLTQYQSMQPWPMADGQACSGKYSPCPFIPVCLEGETAETTKLYKIRKEHLSIRKEKMNV